MNRHIKRSLWMISFDILLCIVTLGLFAYIVQAEVLDFFIIGAYFAVFAVWWGVSIICRRPRRI